MSEPVVRVCSELTVPELGEGAGRTTAVGTGQEGQAAQRRLEVTAHD